jgi:RNA polymerase sigma factor (sigma-70 family)
MGSGASRGIVDGLHRLCCNMYGILCPANESGSDLESIVVFCSSTAWSDAAITSAMALREDLADWRPVEWLDDAAIVLAVQSFLRRKKARPPASPSQQQVWDHFYRHYHRLVRYTVASSCRRAVPTVEADDLSQEVWEEIVFQLPRLAYDSARATLSSWLTGLARRKVHRSSRRPPCLPAKRLVDVEHLAKFLRSNDLGPEDLCFLGEVRSQLKAALVRLRRQTSARSYEVFWRRFLLGQSVKAVAAIVELDAHEVRCRCHRVKRKWRAVVGGMEILEKVVDALPDENPPRRKSVR